MRKVCQVKSISTSLLERTCATLITFAFTPLVDGYRIGHAIIVSSMMNPGPSGTFPALPTVVHASTGEYRLGKTLGVGADSTIRLATHMSTGALCAIKIVGKASRRPDQLARTRFEGNLGMRLHHPNIMQVIEMLETPQSIMLIMPYAPYGDLLDYVNRRGPLSEREASIIITQVIRALEHAHAHNIIHHDVKLENLLRMEPGPGGEERVILADWGFANECTTANIRTQMCASLHYASPEVVHGTGYSGPEVDVWGMGVCLYALLFGAMPFEGEDETRLRQRICTGDFHIPTSRPLSRSCSDLIAYILTPDRLARPTLKAIMQHPWFKEASSPRRNIFGAETAIETLPSVKVPPIVIPPRGHPLSGSSSGSNPPTPHAARPPGAIPRGYPDLLQMIATQSDFISNLEARLHELEKRSVLYEVHIKQLEVQVHGLSERGSQRLYGH